MTHIITYLDRRSFRLLQKLQKPHFAVRAQSYCRNCKNPFRGLQLQQCSTNPLLLNNRIVSLHAHQDSGFSPRVDLLYVLTGVIYYNFTRETKRRVHRWHLAAIPTTAKDMVGVNSPVHLRDARIGGECSAKRHGRAIAP